MAPMDESPVDPSSGSSSTEDFCYVFSVELERGPLGLGMGLIDGMVSSPDLPCPPQNCGLLLPFLSSLDTICVPGDHGLAREGTWRWPPVEGPSGPAVALLA